MSRLETTASATTPTTTSVIVMVPGTVTAAAIVVVTVAVVVIIGVAVTPPTTVIVVTVATTDGCHTNTHENACNDEQNDDTVALGGVVRGSPLRVVDCEEERSVEVLYHHKDTH